MGDEYKRLREPNLVGRVGILFFQAEDGIRGAQESRGLGDVYKKQVIFLRPRIIDNASLDTSLQDFKRFLEPEALMDVSP